MTDQELKDLIADNAKSIRELRESQKETAEQMKETDRKLNKLSKLYGDYGNNRGEETEDFFYRYFKKNPRLKGIKFDNAERNIIGAEGAEHDIILTNGNASALVSVKYRLHKKDIDSLINTEIIRMKYFMNKFGSNHKLYGGVASYIIKDDVEKYAQDKGLYVISRSGENTIFLNNDNFVAREFA